MLALLGLDKCYSTYESINGDLQHLWQDFILWEKAVFLVQRRSALPSAVTERCVYSTSLSPAVF